MNTGSQTRFPELLASALREARERFAADLHALGGLARVIEYVVLDRSSCDCPGGMYPYPHRHCANCGGKIELDSDAPLEFGPPVAVLPENASACAGDGCDLELHKGCADDQGFCVLCHLDATLRLCQRYSVDPWWLTFGSTGIPSSTGSDSDAQRLSNVHAIQNGALVDAALCVPTADVYYARGDLSTSMPEHIAACSDPAELLQAQRDLDDLAGIVAQRRAELGARLVALTNLRLEGTAV